MRVSVFAPAMAGVNARDSRKISDKERKATEKAFQVRACCQLDDLPSTLLFGCCFISTQHCSLRSTY